ncbi:hypothetical protein [Streptomyces sp. NPDC003032]
MAFIRRLGPPIAAVMLLSVSACGDADAKAREGFREIAQDVTDGFKPEEFCEKRITADKQTCLDGLANAAAYCPFPDGNIPKIVESKEAGNGRTLLIKGKFSNGGRYTNRVWVGEDEGRMKLDYFYWLKPDKQPPCEVD